MVTHFNILLEPMQATTIPKYKCTPPLLLSNMTLEF
jgi:hypothetical protein